MLGQAGEKRQKAACNEFNSKVEKKVISVAIFGLVIQFTFNVPFELNFG